MIPWHTRVVENHDAFKEGLGQLSTASPCGKQEIIYSWHLAMNCSHPTVIIRRQTVSKTCRNALQSLVGPKA